MNPLFQHSSIPSPQDICLRQSRLSLTWPRGPGFLCLIKPRADSYSAGVNPMNLFRSLKKIVLGRNLRKIGEFTEQGGNMPQERQAICTHYLVVGHDHDTVEK